VTKVDLGLFFGIGLFTGLLLGIVFATVLV
jgi:hypothetical protein